MLNGARGSADAGSAASNGALVITFVEDGQIRTVAPASETLLGFGPASLVGVSLLDLIDSHDHSRFNDVVTSLAAGHRRDAHLAMRLIDRTGRPIWMDVELVSSPDGVPDSFSLSARPYMAGHLSEHAKAEARSADPYHALVQNSADILMLVDPDGTVRFANPTMLRTLALLPDQLLGTQVLEIIHPDDHPEVTQAMIDVLEHPEHPRTIVMRARHGDGTFRWIEGAMRNLLDHPDVGGILGNGRDITDRREAEAALRASEARFRSLAASAPNAVFEVDADGMLLYANGRWVEVIGVEPSIAGAAWEVVHRDDAAALAKAWKDGGCRDGLEMQLRVQRPDGTVRWVEVRTKPVLDDDGRVQTHVGTMHDVTDLVRYQDELSFHAHHDPLTGLPNRRVLLERLDAALIAAARSGTQLALLFIDVDNFKAVNDTFGHQRGDDLLATIAQRLVHTVRPGDLVSRFGGDEFVVLCLEVDGVDEVAALAERLKDVAGGIVDFDGYQIASSVSIGATVADGRAEPKDVLSQADAAMYGAKVRGRNRAEVFDAALHATPAGRPPRA